MLSPAPSSLLPGSAASPVASCSTRAPAAAAVRTGAAGPSPALAPNRRPRATAAGASSSQGSGVLAQIQTQQPALPQIQQLRDAAGRRGVRRGPQPPSSAAATSSVEADELVGPSSLQPEVFEVITYALKLAWTSETYSVHSWMVLLGLLKKESYVACEVLRELGLDDLYGAWNEVLWALNVSDGLQPRAFTPRIAWGERAAAIVQGAVRFGMWAGRDKVATEDLLMAFAASDVLSSLFPDIDLSFERVKHAVEKRTGVKYDLPGYENPALSSQDMFL